MAFMGSAGMILGIIRPDLSEDERDEFSWPASTSGPRNRRCN